VTNIPYQKHETKYIFQLPLETNIPYQKHETEYICQLPSDKYPLSKIKYICQQP